MWRSKFYRESWFAKYIYMPLASFLWFSLLIYLAFVHMITGVPNLWALPVVLVGLVLFLAGKLTVIRKGVRFSFGASAVEHMSNTMAVFYYLGYVLMISGFVLSFRHNI